METQGKIVSFSPYHAIQRLSSYKKDGNIFDQRTNPDAAFAFGPGSLTQQESQSDHTTEEQ
jgi:hypothetical protein